MKYVDEYRGPKEAARFLAAIRETVTAPRTVMEVSVAVNGIAAARPLVLPIVVPAQVGAPSGLLVLATVLAASVGSAMSVVEAGTGSPKSFRS